MIHLISTSYIYYTHIYMLEILVEALVCLYNCYRQDVGSIKQNMITSKIFTIFILYAFINPSFGKYQLKLLLNLKSNF